MFDTQLVKQVERVHDYDITAIKSTNDNHILLGTSANIGLNSLNRKVYNIRLYNPAEGTTVWTSAPLHGEINGMDIVTDSDTGLQKLAVTTSEAVYATR